MRKWFRTLLSACAFALPEAASGLGFLYAMPAADGAVFAILLNCYFCSDPCGISIHGVKCGLFYCDPQIVRFNIVNDGLRKPDTAYCGKWYFAHQSSFSCVIKVDLPPNTKLQPTRLYVFLRFGVFCLPPIMSPWYLLRQSQFCHVSNLISGHSARSVRT